MSDPLAERCRLSARQAASAPPAFTRVLTFDFYDGPETGIAETASGDAYRFEALAESRHRRYRAYVLDRLTDSLPVSRDETRFLTAPEWQLVRRLPHGERYVGISDLWFGGLVVELLAPDAALPVNFSEAHHLLRSKFDSASQLA